MQNENERTGDEASISPSRRGFLATSAKVSAAALIGEAVIAGCAKSAAPAQAQAKPAPIYANVTGLERIRVGLVGCGGRGTGAAENCVNASPAVEIVALGDAFKDRLDGSRANLAKMGERAKVSEERCFVGLDAYQKVIDSGIDLVLLCTPPAFRPQHFEYAVKAGKHVFFEKPVAVDPVGVRSIIASSELAAGKKLSVVAGTCFRHDPLHLETIRRINEGAIGPIISGQNYYNANGLWMHPRKPQWSDLEWQMRNWIYFTWLSGDHIVEQAVHRLDIMNWVMQSVPVSAYGMGGRQARTEAAYGQVFDHFAVEYEYANGVRIMHMCRQNDGTDTRITEYYEGTKGTACPGSGWIKGTNPFKFAGPTTNMYVNEHIDLLTSIRDGKALNEGRQVAESTLTAIIGRMSAYSGKLVTWEDAMKSELDLWPRQKLEFGPAWPVPPVALPGKQLVA